MTIAILDYGMGNLRSVARAIEHVGGKPEVTEDAVSALGADGLVVPGVGHFGACVGNLRDRGLDRVVTEFASSGRPVFAVCVGMQVLFEGSEEDAEAGLGLFEGDSRRLPDEVKVPHMGWNSVRWTGALVCSRGPDGHPLLLRPLVRARRGRRDHGGRDRARRPFAAAVARERVRHAVPPGEVGEPGLRLYEAFVLEAGP